jgi:hypothetical protein
MPVNAIWIVSGLALAATIMTFVLSRRRHTEADLGTVSHRWLAEHRQSREL